MLLRLQPCCEAQEGTVGELDDLGPKALLVEALYNPKVTIAVIQEQELGSEILDKLDGASAPGLAVEDDAAAYFLSEQLLAQVAINSVIRAGNSRVPTGTIFIAGVTSAGRVTTLWHGDQDPSREPDEVQLPFFKGAKNKSWLAFLVPVVNGSELPDAEIAAPLFAELYEKQVFVGNLYTLYARGGAIPLTDTAPTASPLSPFSLQAETLVDLQFIADTVAANSDLAKKYFTNNMLTLQGKVKSPLAKDLVELISRKEMPPQ